jgi:hypothetical protein
MGLNLRGGWLRRGGYLGAGAVLGAVVVGPAIATAAPASPSVTQPGIKGYAKGFYSAVALANRFRVVVSLKLPAGHYIVTAKAVIAGGTNTSAVACGMYDGKTQYDLSGDSVQPQQFSPVTVLGGLPAGGVVSMQCEELGKAAHGYIAQSGYITAIPVTSISAP